MTDSPLDALVRQMKAEADPGKHGHYHYASPHGRICRERCLGPVIFALSDGRCDGFPPCSACHPDSQQEAGYDG